MGILRLIWPLGFVLPVSLVALLLSSGWLCWVVGAVVTGRVVVDGAAVDAVVDVVDATVEAAQMNVNAKEIAANNNKETKCWSLVFLFSNCFIC